MKQCKNIITELKSQTQNRILTKKIPQEVGTSGSDNKNCEKSEHPLTQERRKKKGRPKKAKDDCNVHELPTVKSTTL